MAIIQHEKLDQAVALLPGFTLDCWLLLVRETGELADPSLPLIFDSALTWQPALLIGRQRRKDRHCRAVRRP